LLISKQISSVELTSAVLARIHDIDPKLNSFITISEERALEQARKADTRLKSGEGITELTGIPYGVKDCISTKGIVTTCGSKILEGYVPPFSATVIQKLDSAGAVMIGKQNMDEFGMGSSCENSSFFDSHNPWDLERVPGGSSGGSAAAVSAGLGYFSIGEDTGGSIRMPASFCGIVGLKPTYGRVSRYGHVALASSFDCIGPLTRNIQDCASVMQIITGHDPKDGTALPDPVPNYSSSLGKSIRGLRIGIPMEYFQSKLEPGVETAIQQTITQFEKLGAIISDVSLPHTQSALPVYYLILFAEASSNLARFDGIRFGHSKTQEIKNIIAMTSQTREEGFGNEVKRRIMLGTYILSEGYYDAFYLKAQKVRSLIRNDFINAFKNFDLLLAPASPSTAFKLGEKTEDPLMMYLSDIFVVATNPAGVPAISIPCGFSNGLPVGIQLIGNYKGEEMILQAGEAFQNETDWHKMYPTIL
jgi:aspartyl-tRNA(Asn)/glutamyl-tRNA(Gln) amidotransferase subunit A